jgi:hypothetical protein
LLITLLFHKVEHRRRSGEREERGEKGFLDESRHTLIGETFTYTGRQKWSETGCHAIYWHRENETE